MLDHLAAWHLKQRRLFPDPLAAWAIQLHVGDPPISTPSKPRGDHGRPAYAQANRNLAMAEVFNLLGYLGLHRQNVRCSVISKKFTCDEATVRKAVKTHARGTGELPRPWECWPAPTR